MADGGMTIARVQGGVRELLELVQQVRVAVTPSAILSADEEARVFRDLQAKLEAAEQLHQVLVSLKGASMTSAQVGIFHERFLHLQQGQYHNTRAALVTQVQAERTSAAVTTLATALQEKLLSLEQTLFDAAKQAARRVQAHDGDVNRALLESSATPAPPAASVESDAAAQIRALLTEKDRLLKSLSHSERELKHERVARAKAEKSLAKHEERWRALNEKVAAKKALQAAATVSNATNAAATAAVMAQQSGTSVTSGASVASTSSGDGAAPKQPLSLAQSGRPSSGTTPPTLHVARPVQVTFGANASNAANAAGLPPTQQRGAK